MELPNVKAKRATLVQTIILLVLFLGFESTAFAKLHFTAIRGMQEHIQLKPEYEYLDPIAAFNLQRQGFLVNLVNYPIEEESGKLDPISVWIKSVYTAPQNSDSPTFFQVSPLVKNFAWLLGPSAIGHILGKLAISESDKLKFKNKALQNQLKNDLKILIEKDSEFQGNIKSADESAQEYQKQMDKFEFPERKLKEQSLIRNRDQIKALGNQALELKQINKKISSHQLETKALLHKMREATPEYHKLREKRDRFAYEKKYLDSFLDKLIKGWLAESSDSVVMGVDHPTHVIEKALVSLAWMNTEDFNKPQFLALYEGIPHVLKGNHLDTGEWRREQYKDSDYKTLVKSLNELGERDKMARYLLKHSEVAAFLSHGEMVFDTTKLPEIGYKSITYKSKKLGYDVSFSDCMDSSILNFLANTLRNPETGVFDPDWMQKLLGAREFRINPEFLKFVKNHPSLSSLDSKAAHEEWAPLVSDLQGVNYVQPGYEVDTQVSNIFHILDHLLFNPSSDEAHSLNEESGTTNEMKMNRLCRFLSPKNRELGWSISGGNGEIFNHTNTGVTLHFTLNKQPYFEWIISAGHSEIRPFRLKNKSWKYGLAGIMIGTIKNEKDENLKAQQVQSVVGLIDKDDLELFLETLIQQKGAFRSLNLDSNERKLTLIEAVLVNHLKPYYSFIKKLDKTLPTAEDLHTSQRREAMFAKGDYPFGDPLHLIGKPERTYTRVSKDPKLAANLVAHHGKYFEKAWKDPRGIVWAEPLKSETGRIVGMTHFEATQFCNSIHASLPTGENWRNLMSDMETPQGMIPQFLSDLYGESYWSSTLHIYSSLNSDDPPDHSNPEEAFYFEGAGEEMHFMGDRFFVDFIDRRHKAGVRCITREK